MPAFLRLPVLLFHRYYRALWLRITLYALLSLVVAIGTALIRRYLPPDLSGEFGGDAIQPILTILASSMLAVSTFSLNVMVSAHRSAASNATPRINRLLLDDTTTQSVLATFIGAFVYALTTLILFQAGFYAENTLIVVMAVTVVVVVLVIIAMLRWIDQLSTLGSLDESLQLAQDQARPALKRLSRTPAKGALPLSDDIILPETLTDIPAAKSGYVQIIDVAGLNGCAGPDHFIYVCREPGRYVLAGQPVARVSGSGHSAESLRTMAGCFVIGPKRTAEEDPEFGLLTLSEIASKALSPGINDPGTAIEAIARVTALLWAKGTVKSAPEAPRYTQVFLKPPSDAQLIEAAFGATARDGAGTIEVALQLRQALLALSSAPEAQMAKAAEEMAKRALDYSERALTLEMEKERLRTTRPG
nr:DUF2254 domain-containing protein [uncultured Celeribacter sp.]